MSPRAARRAALRWTEGWRPRASEDFKLGGRVIQFLGGGDGADFGLVGPGGNNDGDGKLAHGTKAKGPREKGQSTKRGARAKEPGRVLI